MFLNVCIFDDKPAKVTLSERLCYTNIRTNICKGFLSADYANLLPSD